MDTYEFITTKINALKKKYSAIRSRPDYYVFSALFIKAAFYKNPELTFSENDFNKMIVDGKNDMGIDILLFAPDSEGNDLVIGQSKFCKTVTSDEVLNAMRKMADGYKELKNGHYELANDELSSRFAELDDRLDEESRIHFVFYTSAPKKSINKKRLETKFLEEFLDTDNIEVSILFDADIKKEIEDALKWKSIVDHGEIRIDKKNNHLLYGENAAIVNVSAFSIKNLYAEYKTNLLSLNLRYHIAEKKRDSVDNAIKNTIDNNPESFWLKNNGITIICDSFEFDGVIVRLTNFSIVNGGQTTYQLYKNSNLDAAHDFYLPCKIIRNVGETKDEKMRFSLEIAQAANSQKPITQDDLKANAPEQRSFAQAMRAIGVFYQTKRGEIIESQFATPYLHTKLLDAGKLCLAAIFQEPCKSRSKPSAVYSPEYYEPIFNSNQAQIAQICKELLYADDYFTKKFLPKFDRENKDLPDAAVRTAFAHIARTICIAFTALAARYHCGNINDKDVTTLISAPKSSDVYKMLRNLGDMKTLLPIKLYTDAYDAALEKLFAAIIEEGITIYSFKVEDNKSLTAANFLKQDENYYLILKKRWATLRTQIRKVFADV